jgi:hypothetical protein
VDTGFQQLLHGYDCHFNILLFCFFLHPDHFARSPFRKRSGSVIARPVRTLVVAIRTPKPLRPAQNGESPGV